MDSPPTTGDHPREKERVDDGSDLEQASRYVAHCEMYLTGKAKELSVIKAGGCPAGISLARADDLETWEFDIAVLGDETIYKVG